MHIVFEGLILKKIPEFIYVGYDIRFEYQLIQKSKVQKWQIICDYLLLLNQITLPYISLKYLFVESITKLCGIHCFPQFSLCHTVNVFWHKMKFCTKFAGNFLINHLEKWRELSCSTSLLKRDSSRTLYFIVLIKDFYSDLSNVWQKEIWTNVRFRNKNKVSTYMQQGDSWSC